jgi:hypothetical protein
VDAIGAGGDRARRCESRLRSQSIVDASSDERSRLPSASLSARWGMRFARPASLIAGRVSTDRRPGRAQEDGEITVSFNQLLVDQPQPLVAGSATLLGEVHVGAGAILAQGLVIRAHDGAVSVGNHSAILENGVVIGTPPR